MPRPLTRALTAPLACSLTPALSGPTYDIYVDSTMEDDSGDGLSMGTAKKTLAAASTLITEDNTSIGLARGSTFIGEVLDFTGTTGGAIGVYTGTGTTAPPEIYGRTLLTFTKTTGHTNIYEADIDKASWGGTSDNFITVFASTGAASTTARSDELLQELDFDTNLATTLTNLDSQQDNYFQDKSVTPAKVYVHTHDSSSPITNGRAYSASQIQSCIIGAETVAGLYYDGCTSDDGLRASHHVDAESVNHVNHNFYLEADGNGNCSAINCISRNARARNGYAIDARNSAGPFIWFESSGTGKSCVIGNCQSIQSAALNEKLQNDYVGAYGCHATGGALTSFTVTASYAENGGLLAVSPGNVQTVNVTHNRFLDLRYGVTLGAGNVTANIIANYFRGSTMNPLRSMERVVSNAPSGITVNFLGNVVQPSKSSNGTIDCSTHGTWNINYNTFEDEYDYPNILSVRIRSADAVVNMNHNIFDGSNWPVYVDGDYGGNISGDNNLYYDSAQGWQYNGSTTQDIATWRTDSGADANGLIAAPSWTNDPATWDELSDATAASIEAAALKAGAEHYPGQT